MNAAQAKKVSLYELLNSLGFAPSETRKGGNEVWYNSPFRSEAEPSFKIRLDQNVWYDFGEGEGGNILDFVMKFNSCDFSNALAYLGNASKTSSPTFVTPFKKPSEDTLDIFNLKSPLITDIKPVYHFALKEYLKERCIAPEVGYKYLKEINYKVGDSFYFALGFPNRSNGWEIRSPIFKGCLGNKDISLIENGSDKVKVYEGFMDFLSDLTIAENSGKGRDILILNSTSMRNKGIEVIKEKGYMQAETYFDNDSAGKTILELFQKELSNITITPLNGIYEPYNDLNDYLKQVYKKQVQ